LHGERSEHGSEETMIIDVHTHIGDLRSPWSLGRAPIRVADLIARLDEEGIDRAVVLPWPPCPEGVTFPALFGEAPDIVGQIRLAATRPDRLILFGNADPRWGGNSARTDWSWLLDRYQKMGCVGMGEVSANIPFDDPRMVNLARQCGERGLPITFESAGPGEGRYGLVDEVGSPHLARLLEEAPATTFIGHGPGFWAEIGAGLDSAEKSGYPRGPISGEGSLFRLFRDYPNLYADTSAHSGFNALTRDPEWGLRFLHEFQDRLMFGTDVCFADPEGRMPHLRWLRGLLADGQISREIWEKITHRNAERILPMTTPPPPGAS
jgi:predicted TIM-barrel fold metal-dependent hydrolase